LRGRYGGYSYYLLFEGQIRRILILFTV